jgi:hypothetical protein
MNTNPNDNDDVEVDEKDRAEAAADLSEGEDTDDKATEVTKPDSLDNLDSGWEPTEKAS